MKPSERINQIKINYSNSTGISGSRFTLEAIIDYLDEEYEKNLTPEQRQIREIN